MGNRAASSKVNDIVSGETLKPGNQRSFKLFPSFCLFFRFAEHRRQVDDFPKKIDINLNIRAEVNITYERCEINEIMSFFCLAERLRPVGDFAINLKINLDIRAEVKTPRERREIHGTVN